MSGQKGQQPSTNLLFSPSNDLFGGNGTSALLMPVEDASTSALMMSDNIAEADSFVGQNQTEQPAVFSMFSGSDASDPFASVGGDSGKVNGVTTSEHQPSLFVPSAEAPQVTSPEQSNLMAAQIPNERVASPGNFPPPSSQGFVGMPPASSSPYPNAAGRLYTRPRYVAPDYGMSSSASATISQPQFQSPMQPPPIVMANSPVRAPHSSPAPPASFNKLASSVPPPPTAQSMYHPVSPHWCHCKELSDGSYLWKAFSYYDSGRLENAAATGSTDVLPTDGGRYDADVSERTRTSVYWEEPTALVRRCTWFAKGDTDHRYEPFEEVIAEMLEQEYEKVVKSNTWHKQVDLDGGEMVVIHNPQVIVHLVPREDRDPFSSVPEHGLKSRIVKRGISEIDLGKEIPENEIGGPDHVVFVCHGIGPVCDLRSKTIVECVDDFRTIQLSLLKSHFKNALESKRAHRIEFLPIHWHRALHGNASGVDRDIRRLTLPSIQRLRHFTNESLLDILFYSSPVYCQTIAETIGSEINSLYQLFLSRTPGFSGKFSVAGHSLGALMLFDLLCHQKVEGDLEPAVKPDVLPTPLPSAIQDPKPPSMRASPVPSSASTHDNSTTEDSELALDDVLSKLNLMSFKEKFDDEQIEMESLLLCTEGDLKDLGLPMGPRKKLVGYLKHLQEESERKKVEKEAEMKQLSDEKVIQENVVKEEVATHLPAQLRLDSVSSLLSGAMNVHVDFQQFESGTGQPMVKYPHLLFEPSVFFAIGSPIGMFLTVRGLSDLGEEFSLPTCKRFFNIFHPYDPLAYRIEPLINPEVALKPIQVPHYKGRKRLHLELRDSIGRMGSELKQGIINSVKMAMESMQKFAHSHWQKGSTSEEEVEEEVRKVTDSLIKEQERSHENDDASSVASDSSQSSMTLMGKINGGQRVDYVLQERPLESFNDYLFAFQSQLCYWNSEDTVLLMMNQVYKDMDILPDSKMKVQTGPPLPVHGQPPMMRPPFPS